MQPNRIGHAFAKPTVTFSEIRTGWKKEAERPDLHPGQVGEFNLAKSGGICPASGA